MRELAYIEKIKALRPIEGADKIECAEILGFELVVRKGEFKVGDLCVYCEVDSIFTELPPFEFLRSKKFRIKTIKLRGQISQGIAFPLSVIKEVDPSFDLTTAKVGQDLTDVLKITKYDPERELDLPDEEPVKKTWWQRKIKHWQWKLFGFKPIKTGDFPSDVPRTDETRVQKMGPELEKHQGQSAYISEKIEGCSGTVVYRKTGNWFAQLLGMGYIFQVCSRNRIIYNSQKNGQTTHHICQAIKRYNMLDGLKKLNRNIAIQFETIGPKIQGNVYRIPNLDIRVFLMYDIDAQKYIPFMEMEQIAKQLGAPLVPIVARNVQIVNDIKYYVELSKGQSLVNSKIDREGIVIRTLDEDFSFKSINLEYLLANELKK